MMKLKYVTWLAALGLLALALPAKADPSTAEDDAYSMAVHYTARGFAMSPTNSSGLGGSGFTVRLRIPVSKGVDYVILVGKDGATHDLDLYVYDEVGTLVLDDRRPDSRAGVKFRSSYSGTVDAYVLMARASGLGAYAVLVGRRGVDKSAGSMPAPNGTTDTVVPPAAAPAQGK